jgi:dolichol-phosphate mannosyltransferase
MRVVVTIPTYNEAGGIEKFLATLSEVFAKNPQHDWNVLVVDANSPDGTAQVVRNYAKSHPNFFALVEEKKRGIGAAYTSGFAYSIENLAPDVLISFDGDGQHNPNDLPRLMAEIDHGYDYVIGSRYVPGGSIPKEWEPHRKLLSRFGSLYARVLLDFPVHDVTSGMRAMRVKNFAEKLPLRHEDMITFQYSYIFQYLYEMLRLGAKVKEIPIVFLIREHDTSKNTWKDIIESLRVTGILFLRKNNF